MNAADIATFSILVGLELVLGIDNVLLISIVTGRLPASQRELARKIALGLALLLRIVLVMGAAYIVKLNDEVIWGLSWKGIVLILGGAFLLYKSVKEIHHVVEGQADAEKISPISLTFRSAITQLIILDLVFSIDSVITAVGLSSNLVVIVSAVVVSFAVVLYSASSISAFVDRHPAMKILALSFLVTIGVTLFMEGMGHHVPKGYIYLPMGFALGVELLQMRYSSRRTPKA